MLVLSRVAGEWVDIDVPASSEDQRISVLVTETEKHRASLGFEADKSIKIFRRELLEREQKESK